MDPTVLFTYLKIISLQSIFSFRKNKLYPNRSTCIVRVSLNPTFFQTQPESFLSLINEICNISLEFGLGLTYKRLGSFGLGNGLMAGTADFDRNRIQGELSIFVTYIVVVTY